MSRTRKPILIGSKTATDAVVSEVESIDTRVRPAVAGLRRGSQIYTDLLNPCLPRRSLGEGGKPELFFICSSLLAKIFSV